MKEGNQPKEGPESDSANSSHLESPSQHKLELARSNQNMANNLLQTSVEPFFGFQNSAQLKPLDNKSNSNLKDKTWMLGLSVNFWS